MTNMSTLAAQFKEMQKNSKKQADMEVLKSMTLEELATEKIMFAEAKRGVQFSKAFEDSQWTEFILNRFEESPKPEYRMFLTPIPQDVWEELQTPGAEPVMMDAPLLIQEEVEDLRSSNQHLFRRMGQIEMMMQEMMKVMQKMQIQVKNED